MIKQETFSKKNIDRIVLKYKIDFELASRAVFALGLIEALKRVEANFIFKGGSSLMLLFKSLKRLSTDVDIIVPPNYDIEKYLDKASNIFPFKGIKEAPRKTSKNIEKRHYKITYNSLNSDKSFSVLVDVLFAEQHYKKTVECPINNDLLICEGKDIFVTTPTIESLLGDKLTAFAPHTIGINFFGEKFSSDKRLEVVKQFYDISCLFEASTNFQEIIETYRGVALDEINYRNLNISINDCLLDTYNSALSILSLGKFQKEEYPNYVSGFKKISGHIIEKRLNPNNAFLNASEIMLLSVCILKNKNPFTCLITDQKLLKDSPYNKINFVNKVDKKAFNYAATAIRILNEEPL